MQLLTKAIEKKLRLQHTATKEAGGANLHHKPVVRFFGGSSFTMLASEMDDDGNLFGVTDMGLGYKEMGLTSITELAAVKFPPFGLPVERDLHWHAEKTLEDYAMGVDEL